LSTPALRLVKGGYTHIAFASGRELNVLARSADDSSSLYVMRFANPSPCEIPDVGRYVASRNPNRAEAGIAYFHDDAAQGTLHFADTSCKTFDFEIEDALLPVGETDHSVIVWAGGKLLEVEPQNGKRSTLASNVTNLVTRAFSGRTFVFTDEGLEVFGGDWKSQGTFGQSVTSVFKTSNGALYLDATGLRRLSAGDNNTTTKDELVQADVCDFGMRDDTWATFHSPCSGPRLRALHIPSGSVHELDFEADPLYLRLIPARGSPGANPNEDPFWFLFLRSVSSSLGTLVVRDPSRVEHVIGENATLARLDLIDSGTVPYGYALVNVTDHLGDYVFWNTEGRRHTLAHQVLDRGDGLLIDWDGNSGTLAATSGDRLVTLAKGIPERNFAFADGSREWTVLFHDWQGDSGRLSRFSGTLDALMGTPIDAPLEPPELVEIAPSVGISTTALLNPLIPGTIFLEDYDASTDTGRLTYENAELRFKANVDHGVSDYLVTSSNLLYTIPFGENQGIWLSTGK